MKVNIFLTIISVVLAVLIGYLAFNVAESKNNDIIYGIGSTVCFIATLVPTMGVQYESGRLGANLRVLSALFFMVFLIVHFSFAAFGGSMPYYIITNGILLMIYLSIFYRMNQ